MVRYAAFLEALIVCIALAAIARLAGDSLTDWSASFAVFLGFLYSQLSFDLAEAATLADEQSPSPITANRLRKIFMLKEATWIITFFLLGSWPLLAGAMMFLSYPTVRSALRRSYSDI